MNTFSIFFHFKNEDNLQNFKSNIVDPAEDHLENINSNAHKKKTKKKLLKNPKLPNFRGAN